MWFFSKNKGSSSKSATTEISSPLVISDPMVEEAVRITCQYDRVSASLLQRRLSIGYSRAARIIDELEALKMIGGADGAKPREVLVKNVDQIKFLRKDNNERPQQNTSETTSETQEREQEAEKVWFYPPLSLLDQTKVNNENAITSLRSLFEDETIRDNKSKLNIPLGVNMLGEAVAMDTNNHCLIVGASGVGKSRLIKSLVTALLFKNSPSELRLIIIDSKGIDLPDFNGIPHLLTPVITDQYKVLSALKWTNAEIDRRRKSFNEATIKDIKSYNEHKGFQALPNIIVVVDGLDELMLYVPEIEDILININHFGSLTGIFVIASTQKPSRDSIRLFSTKIALKVHAKADSEITLGKAGAEKLIVGDALYLPNGAVAPECIQTVTVDPQEVLRVKNYVTNDAVKSVGTINSDQLETKNNQAEPTHTVKSDYIEFLDSNKDLMNKFCEIAARKVSVIDEYGDESWKELTPEKQRCFTKICLKLGLTEKFMSNLFLELEAEEIAGAGISNLISYMGQQLRFSLANANSSNIHISYFLVKLYYYDLEKLFRDAYKDYKGSPKVDIDFDTLSGINFEVYIENQLKEHGYDVNGTPITGDQGADILAVKNGKKYIIQAKRYTGAVGNKAVQEVAAAKSYYKGDLAVVVTNSTFTPAAKDLAQKNNVFLVNGDSLSNLYQLLEKYI